MSVTILNKAPEGRYKQLGDFFNPDSASANDLQLVLESHFLQEIQNEFPNWQKVIEERVYLDAS